MKDINNQFEKLIDRISIKKTKESYIKGQLKYFKRHLKDISKDPSKLYFYNYNPSLDFEETQFNYGGFFDRHNCVKNRYDIDAYIVYAKKREFYDLIMGYKVSGEDLFTLLRHHLETFHSEVNEN